jgi:serine/threonine protein phosphatase PrpC
MKVSASAFSECGPYRQMNEDCIYCDDVEGLFVVADGMGGLPDGKHASESAVRLFVQKYISTLRDNDFHVRAERALNDANRNLFEDSLARGMRSGTTLTAAHVIHGTISFIHIGDTAIWKMNPKENSAELLTREDTLARQYVLKGRSQEFASEYKNILTQAVGLARFIAPQFGRVEARAHDIFILCSDGFTDCVSPTEILSLAASYPCVGALAARSKELVVARHPRDNFSAIFVTSQ